MAINDRDDTLMIRWRPLFGYLIRPPVPPGGTGGFTVLEVLVAIALLGIVLIPLLTLQQSTTRAALAVDRAQERLAIDRNALAYLRSVNFLLQPEGQARLGEANFRWTARPISSPQPMLTAEGQRSRFDLQRFAVTADITMPDGRNRSWTVELLGWRARLPLSETF